MRTIEGPSGDAMTVVASVFWRQPPASRGRSGLGLTLVVIACAAWLSPPAPPATAQGEDIAPAATQDDEERPAAEDAGVFLPSDRAKERQLDRAARLLAAGDWADAAALLDEILADDRDAFVVTVSGDGTRRSIRSEATRLITTLPPSGREAYSLLCRGRADRALADAVASEDTAGVVAVARRWFATPAGRRAAVITAQAALEADDPCTASAWLERLAASGDPAWKPTLTLMRAVAAVRADDRPTAERLVEEARRMPATVGRIGGRGFG